MCDTFSVCVCGGGGGGSCRHIRLTSNSLASVITAALPDSVALVFVFSFFVFVVVLVGAGWGGGGGSIEDKIIT